MDVHNQQQVTPDLCDVRVVRIPDREGTAGRTAVTVSLLWACSRCGAPRGTPYPSMCYDLDGPLEVDAWANPCGHADLYADLRNEAGITA